MILSTHILPEVEATCDRILIINKGRIVADGTPNTLRKQAQGKQVLHLRLEDVEAGTALEAFRQLPEISGAEVLNPDEVRLEVQSQPEATCNRAVFELCKKRNWVLAELVPMETKLEDIFRELTMN